MHSTKQILILSVLVLIQALMCCGTAKLIQVEEDAEEKKREEGRSSIDQFKGKLRLPKFAAPKRYQIRLKPDLIAFKFSGTVKIEVEIVSGTAFLVLNAADLNVTAGSIHFKYKHSSKVLEPIMVEMVKEDEILVLEFSKILPMGIGVLAIDFEGSLDDNLKGFYRSTYELNGEKRPMAVTQFEPLDARRCFPCWDEPARKARFKMLLDVPSELMALSNMPVIREKTHRNHKTVTFQESPIMSTYLVAVVIGLFDYVENHTSDGIRVRVYCPVGQADKGKFALDVAVRTLDLYREYFAVPYALPKLDMISIPDFEPEGMENYGLLTFGEIDLLYDERYPEAYSQLSVASDIAHELAHQWFGNLVTMEWWTHIWLNEGFATWLSGLAIDILFPEWGSSTMFVNSTATVLRLDARPESHPIEVEINDASEVNSIFNYITYGKGAAILQMLQNYLGPEVLQRLLTSYLKKYAWSNANTEDLWAVLEKGSGKPVSRVMSPWTKQQGFPLVTVKVFNQKLKFEQVQFLSSGSHGIGQWTVPITFCCGSYVACHSFLLQKKSTILDMKEIPDCLCAKDGRMESQGNGSYKENNVCPWIKVNVNQTGFYRVKYDKGLVARLKYAIKKNYLSATDRFGFLDDLLALSMAHQMHLP